MSLAEVIDALRIFPRILILAYGYLVGYELIMTTIWYYSLELAARTLEVTGFFSMLIGGLFGLAAYVFKTYTDGGYDWDKYRAYLLTINLPESGRGRDLAVAAAMGGAPRASG